MMKTMKESKVTELVGVIEELQEKLNNMLVRANRGEGWGPTISPLAVDIDIIQAQIRLLENQRIQEVSKSC